MKKWYKSKQLWFNGLGALVVAGLTYVAGVNWQEYVSPTTGMLIVFVANSALRLVTEKKLTA